MSDRCVNCASKFKEDSHKLNKLKSITVCFGCQLPFCINCTDRVPFCDGCENTFCNQCCDDVPCECT